MSEILLGNIKGPPGDTPYIKGGYWWIGDLNTQVPTSTPGPKGDTPEIKEGYWWISGKNTGVLASPKGDPGKSAYEIAVEEGFSGTASEWLASLKGGPGEKGKDGQDGVDGKNGTNGKDGLTTAVNIGGATTQHVNGLITIPDSSVLAAINTGAALVGHVVEYDSAAGKLRDSGHTLLKSVPADAVFTDTVYVHPTTAGYKHIPAGGKSGQILRWASDGTVAWGEDNNTTYGIVTTTANGLMIAADKIKLDGIQAGANKYTHPGYTAQVSGLYKITVDELGHVKQVATVTKEDIVALGIPGQDTNTTYGVFTASANGLVPLSGGGTAKYLRADGTWQTPPNTIYTHPSYTSRVSGLYKITVDALGHVTGAVAVTKADITALGIPGQDTNTTYSPFKGATTSAAGTSGLVIAPPAGAANRYLRSDGTWAVPPDTNTTYGVATQAANGLLSAADKKKLDGIAAGANAYTHPGYTARASGLYKITVDAQGHVSVVTAVTKGDITALGIPAQDTNTTYNVATQSANGLMSAADKKKLDGMVVANFNKVTVSTSAPSNPQKGDIWI